MPSQFRNRGDRLVFSNGVVVLAGLAAVLIWAFDAQPHAADPALRGRRVHRVHAVAGRAWCGGGSAPRRARGGAARSSTASAPPRPASCSSWSRSRSSPKGAWIVIVAMPFIVLFFLGGAPPLRARRRGAAGSAPHGAATTRPSTIAAARPRPGSRDARRRGLPARGATRVAFGALYVGAPGSFDGGRRRVVGRRAPAWATSSRSRAPTDHLVRAVRALHAQRCLATSASDFVTVVIPELLPRSTIWAVPAAPGGVPAEDGVAVRARVVVTDVPLVPSESRSAWPSDRPVEPERSVVLVPVSAVHDPTVRAVVYGEVAAPDRDRGHLHGDRPRGGRRRSSRSGTTASSTCRSCWSRRRSATRSAAARGDPRAYRSRRHRGHRRAARARAATLVGEPLHNQTALFFKRVLLFEPGVVVTSVPFHLAAPEVGDDADPAPEGVGTA